MKGRTPGKELKTVHSRIEPGTGIMMIGTDETYQGLPVLKSLKTGRRYLFKSGEESVISRREPQSKGHLVVDEPSTLPYPCETCGSTLGRMVSETYAGRNETGEDGANMVRIYRCTGGHVIRYGGH